MTETSTAPPVFSGNWIKAAFVNNSGDPILATLDTGIMNNTTWTYSFQGHPLAFTPAGMTNRTPTGPNNGQVVAVIGTQSDGTPIWWDGSASHTDIPEGALNPTPFNINSMIAVVNGQNVPAYQMLGVDSEGAFEIWNMNPVTTKFRSPVQLQNLIPGNSGWNGLTLSYDFSGINAPHFINDAGAIICAAVKNSDGASHGLLLCPMQVIDSTNTVLNYVRFGLWDNAFGNADNLLSGFVDNDSRRFYLRVVDPSANLDPGTAETITVNWYTKTGAGADDDHPGASGQPSGVSTLTLTETGANTGVFISQALMLVADDVDNAQTTPPGTSNSGGAWHATNHRLRRAALGDQMCFSYTPAATGSQNTDVSVPIFNPSTATGAPDTIKTMTVQIANCRGGVPEKNNVPMVAQSDDFVTAVEASVKAHYAVAGIKVNISYQLIANGAGDLISIPPSSLVDLNSVNGGTGASDEDEGKLATIAKNHYPAASPNTIFMILINQFKPTYTPPDPSHPSDLGSWDQIQGESFSDGNAGPGDNWAPSDHCCFVARATTYGKKDSYGTYVSSTTSVPPHELGHQLTSPTSAYFSGASGNHYDGTNAFENLMLVGASDPIPGSVTGSKRLWDDSGHKYLTIPITNQIDFMRTSNLLR